MIGLMFKYVHVLKKTLMNERQIVVCGIVSVAILYTRSPIDFILNSLRQSCLL